MDYESSSKEGALLEKSVATLFSRSGFDVKLNHIEYVDDVKNEIDVLVVTPQGERIIIECKQRRDETTEILKTYLDALVGKKTRLNADKALLVTNATVKEQYTSYESNGVYFWDGEELFKLQSLPEKQLVTEVYAKLGLKIMDEDGESNKIGISGFFNLLEMYWKAGLIVLVAFFLLIYIFWEPIIKAITFVLGLIALIVILAFILAIVQYLPKSNQSIIKRKKKRGKIKKVVYYK